MEIQVLDDFAAKYADLKPWQYTGSIYGLQAPSERAAKSAGQWQKMIITCKGSQVSVVLNDHPIIDADLINFMSEESTHPGIVKCGVSFDLQNHSTRIEYRNIILNEY